jgi:hypothetical protein
MKFVVLLGVLAHAFGPHRTPQKPTGSKWQGQLTLDHLFSMLVTLCDDMQYSLIFCAVTDETINAETNNNVTVLYQEFFLLALFLTVFISLHDILLFTHHYYFYFYLQPRSTPPSCASSRYNGGLAT